MTHNVYSNRRNNFLLNQQKNTIFYSNGYFFEIIVIVQLYLLYQFTHISVKMNEETEEMKVPIFYHSFIPLTLTVI